MIGIRLKLFFTMNAKAKKILFIALFGLDIALTMFLFIVSIIMIATMPATKQEIDTTTFIGYLQGNPNLFLFAFVVPLFALLAVNIFALVMYLRKTSKAKQVKLNELSDAEKEALRRELMKDLAGGAKEEEKPAEEPKNEAEPTKEEE